MVKESKHTEVTQSLMVTSMMANIVKVICMDMEPILGLVEIFMKENGNRVTCTDMEN